jgi:hypothetical protein
MMRRRRGIAVFDAWGGTAVAMEISPTDCIDDPHPVDHRTRAHVEARGRLMPRRTVSTASIGCRVNQSSLQRPRPLRSIN